AGTAGRRGGGAGGEWGGGRGHAVLAGRSRPAGGGLRRGGRGGLLQGLAGARRRAGTGRRRWARRRELPRMAWGRPAMAWGLARSSRRPRVVPLWRPATLPGPGWALRPLGDGGPARRGHRLQRAFPARAAGEIGRAHV